MPPIRAETSRDYELIHRVNEEAFGRCDEADLVSVLRERARPLISLVADLHGEVVGHILFSPVTLPTHADLLVMALAPMAVVPAHQGAGVGSALVRAGLTRCEALGAGAVVVLGHPRYYPRFGFVPARRFGLRCPYDVPDDAFMAIELKTGYLNGDGATVRFHPAFDGV